MSVTGSGIYVATDPDQESKGYYRVGKTANISSTIKQLNNARAQKDFKLVCFYPCADLKKIEDFIKSAMKKKYIPNSTDWVSLPDEKALSKAVNTIESLVEIVNDE